MANDIPVSVTSDPRPTAREIKAAKAAERAARIREHYEDRPTMSGVSRQQELERAAYRREQDRQMWLKPKNWDRLDVFKRDDLIARAQQIFEAAAMHALTMPGTMIAGDRGIKNLEAAFRSGKWAPPAGYPVPNLARANKMLSEFGGKWSRLTREQKLSILGETGLQMRHGGGGAWEYMPAGNIRSRGLAAPKSGTYADVFDFDAVPEYEIAFPGITKMPVKFEKMDPGVLGSHTDAGVTMSSEYMGPMRSLGRERTGVHEFLHEMQRRAGQPPGANSFTYLTAPLLYEGQELARLSATPTWRGAFDAVAHPLERLRMAKVRSAVDRNLADGLLTGKREGAHQAYLAAGGEMGSRLGDFVNTLQMTPEQKIGFLLDDFSNLYQKPLDYRLPAEYRNGLENGVIPARQDAKGGDTRADAKGGMANDVFSVSAPMNNARFGRLLSDAEMAELERRQRHYDARERAAAAGLPPPTLDRNGNPVTVMKAWNGRDKPREQAVIYDPTLNQPRDMTLVDFMETPKNIRKGDYGKVFDAVLGTVALFGGMSSGGRQPARPGPLVARPGPFALRRAAEILPQIRNYTKDSAYFQRMPDGQLLRTVARAMDPGNLQGPALYRGEWAHDVAASVNRGHETWPSMTFGNLSQILPANYTRGKDLRPDAVPSFVMFRPEAVPLSVGGARKGLTAQFDFDTPASGTALAERRRGLSDMDILRNWSARPGSLVSDVKVSPDGRVVSLPKRFITPEQEAQIKANWTLPNERFSPDIAANPAGETKVLGDLPYDRTSISGIGVATGRPGASWNAGVKDLVEFANDSNIPFVNLHDQPTVRAMGRMEESQRAAEVANRLLSPNVQLWQQDAKGGNARKSVRADEAGGDSPGPETAVSETAVSEPAQQDRGGPRIVINPSTFRNQKDALCVAFNEGFRLWMEANDFQPQSEPTDRQRRFFSDTAYADDELQLRRTILARVATFDTSVKDPTDDQLSETAQFLDGVLESGWCRNEWEQDAVSRLSQAVKAAIGAEPVEPREEPLEPAQAEPLAPAGGEEVQALQGGGSTDDDDEKDKLALQNSGQSDRVDQAEDEDLASREAEQAENVGMQPEAREQAQEPAADQGAPTVQPAPPDAPRAGETASPDDEPTEEQARRAEAANEKDLAAATKEYGRMKASGQLDAAGTSGGAARPKLTLASPVSPDSPGSIAYKGTRPGGIENPIVSPDSPGSIAYKGTRPGGIENPIVGSDSPGSISYKGTRPGGIENPIVSPDSPGSISGPVLSYAPGSIESPVDDPRRKEERRKRRDRRRRGLL